MLRALLADIGDKIFDGKTINATGGVITVQYTCNGTAVNLPIGAGTADVVTALTAFANTTQGQAMDLNGNRTIIDTVKANIIGGAAAPAAIKTLPSQGLIAIDTIKNIGYVPIYTHDASGNGQIAVVDLNVGVANPIITLVSLPGTSTAIALNFFADTGRVYVLAANGSNIVVHVIRASDNVVEFSIPATGLSFNGSFGGVIVDGKRKHVVIAGTSTMALSTFGPNADLDDQLGDQRRRHGLVLAQLRDRRHLRLVRRRQRRSTRPSCR